LANKIIFMSRILFSIILLLSFSILPRERLNDICQPERVWRPFDIEKSPDYLYMDGVNGDIVLTLFISKNGRIVNFNIHHISLARGKDTVLFYHNSHVAIMKRIKNKKDYPAKVQVCYDSIKKYVGQIILKPTRDTIFYKRSIITSILRVKVRCTPIPKYSSEKLNNYFSKKDSANINSIILYGIK